MINDKACEGWYSISGQKLGGKPTVKGIYISSGKNNDSKIKINRLITKITIPIQLTNLSTLLRLGSFHLDSFDSFIEFL